MVPLVRILGPVGITSYTLEEYYDSDNGFYNVAYRIIAPVLCCSTLISIVGIIACAAGAKPPTACYLSVLLYWIIICVIKITKKTILSKMAFAFQAIFSIGIALLLDIYVIPSLVARDFRIPICFIHPLQYNILYFPIASWPSMARVNGPAAHGGACVST